MSDSMSIRPRPGLATRAKSANQRPGRILISSRRARRSSAHVASNRTVDGAVVAPGKAFIVKPARLRLSVLTVKLYLLCLLLLLGPIITFYPKEAHREILGMAFTSAICITVQFFAQLFSAGPNVRYKFGCFSLRAEEVINSTKGIAL